MSVPAPSLPRLAIVLSHPVQYYSPWFRWLHVRAGLTLKVFYLWEFGVTAQTDPEFGTTVKWDVDLLSGYDHEFVPNRSSRPGTDHFRGLDNPALSTRLSDWKPTALLLFGYNYVSHLRVIAWARWNAIPLVFRGDSHLLGRPQTTVIRGLLLRLLYRQFAAVTYVGAANHDYFLSYGVPSTRLFFAPHAVDETRFDPNDAATRQAAVSLRASLGLEGQRVVLFAGKLQSRKQPVELLQAFLQVSTDRDALVFVGDGPEKARLQELAAGNPRVHFLPFANQSEMPARYLMADIFALPSQGYYETWGLAVNEAMHLGKPCLVSDLVGCQRDLVKPGHTGWVFPASDHTALARELRAALRATPEELNQLSANARATIAGYTYQQAGDGLVRALHSLPAD